MNIQLISDHIYDYYEKNNPPENVYHDINHIIEVVEAVKLIAKANSLNENDIQLITISAWFHDIGHIKVWEGHEELGANYAKEFLSNYEISESEIQIIVDCIRVTAIPHNPKNLLEEIICDADVSHVGSENFFEKSILLKKEIELRKNKTFSDIEWIKKNMDFVIQTNFYTNIGKEIFEKQKQINLKKLFQEYKLLSEK
ncbi:MAG: HD domain-containing protein [Ignavibacteriae bacterium]|nr:HD domain-containing protein [Ignavibacteriota bacterium]